MNQVCRVIIALLALIPAAAFAQVEVLGFEIGVATPADVKKQLAKQTRVMDAGTNRFSSGPMLRTDGAGYDIESLTNVLYIFDGDQKLAAVIMTLGKHRFNDIFGIVSSKYKVRAQQRPFVGDQYARLAAPNTVIELDAPHLGFSLEVRYIRQDLFERFNSQARQETQQKRATEKGRF
jgi:hypothetical protein